MSTYTQIPLPTDTELSEESLNRLKQLPALNIHRLLAWVAECHKPWVDLVAGIYQLEFNAKLREIAICRYGYKTEAKYELHQHKVLALTNGVSEEELAIILSAVKVDNLNAEINFICQVVDEFEDAKGVLSDVTFNELLTRYTPQVATQLLIILGHYACVTRVLNASRIPLEEISPLVACASPTSKR